MALERRIHQQHSRYEAIRPDDVSGHVSGDDEEEEQFRLCPRLAQEDSSDCGLAWRLVTLILCLPLCYPCYLTKKTR